MLSINFLGLAAGVLLWRYFRRGRGRAMLRMMNAPMEIEHEHAHPAA